MKERLSRYIDQRFGMFIHYNMDTYLAVSQPKAWAEDRVDPKTFAPPNVDCHTFTDQWAAAAKSAGMTFGLLTTKHHDGFAIWPSKAIPPSSTPAAYNGAPYTIAQSAVPTMDVVQCYTDSFRAVGLDPNLYFSIWDPNNGIGSQSGHNTNPGPISWSVIGDYVVTQLTELLTNYGEIPLVAFDGYSWLTGHQEVPYQQIHALVRRLQPNAIILDHNGGVPWEVDTEYFEEPLGITAPTGNTTAGSQGQTIATDNQWFWSSTTYRTAQEIAAELAKTEPNYTTFILDCPPNMDGTLDADVVTNLSQVPQYWTPNASRPPLPAQLPKIDIPLTAVAATATSGDAGLAVDGLNDSSKGTFSETLWKSSGALPQSVTIDLGQVYSNIDMLECLPQRWTGTTNGNVTSYTILVSTDGTTFTKVTSGTWPADPDYNNLLSPQRVQFTPQSGRYWRFEVDAVAGGGTEAIVGEVAVGLSEAAEGEGGSLAASDGGGDATVDVGLDGSVAATGGSRLDGSVLDASQMTSGGDSSFREATTSDGGGDAMIDARLPGEVKDATVDHGEDGAALPADSGGSTMGTICGLGDCSDGAAVDDRYLADSTDATDESPPSAGAISGSGSGCACSVGLTQDTLGEWVSIAACFGLVVGRRHRRRASIRDERREIALFEGHVG
jgi:alpha-L-fucosidase